MLNKQEVKDAIVIARVELAESVERKDLSRILELTLAISMLKDILIELLESK